MKTICLLLISIVLASCVPPTNLNTSPSLAAPTLAPRYEIIVYDTGGNITYRTITNRLPSTYEDRNGLTINGRRIVNGTVVLRPIYK